MSQSIVFVAAKRTPFGAFGGSLKDHSATDLAVHAARAALDTGRIPPAAVDHVVFGNVLQTSPDAAYLARHVGLRSGVPEATPAVTVNRLCGSGFEAIAQGAALIRLGEASVCLVGGTESMSQAPYVLRGGRFGYRMGHGELEDSLTAGLFDTYAGLPMALTAELLAEEGGFRREACDAYALESQKRAAAARREGRLAEEITPLTLTVKGKSVVLDRDEHVREDASAEGLAKLRPVFKKDGVVTAGNASGMVDGACALVLTTAERAKREGWTVLGELVDATASGCDPKRMGLGPVPATRRLLERHRLGIGELKWIEVNEAFAPQYLAVEKALSLPRERTNADGGAIAIGHPLAASGARLVAHTLYALRRGSGGLGLASACIGGGQGMSVLVKV